MRRGNSLWLWDGQLGYGERSLVFRCGCGRDLDHLRGRRGLRRYAQQQTDGEDVIDLQQQAEARQELEYLLQRLRGLPKRCQQVFLLSRVDGLSYAAIAQQLGVSLSTVEKDIFRVLQHCQRSED